MLLLLETAAQAQQVFRITAIPDESPTELARKAQPLVRYVVALASLVGNQIYQVTAAPARPLVFDATIERVEESYPTPGSFPTDVYFRVIVTGGSVFTWVPNPGGGAALVEGFSPVARAVTETSFSTARVFGPAPQCTFSERDAPGLYSIFALLCRQVAIRPMPVVGTWATKVPLIFKGPTTPALPN